MLISYLYPNCILIDTPQLIFNPFRLPISDRVHLSGLSFSEKLKRPDRWTLSEIDSLNKYIKNVFVNVSKLVTNFSYVLEETFKKLTKFSTWSNFHSPSN